MSWRPLVLVGVLRYFLGHREGRFDSKSQADEKAGCELLDDCANLMLYSESAGFRKTFEPGLIAQAIPGAVSEWFKVQTWKVCVGLSPTESSNLSRSATFSATRHFQPHS